VRILQLSNVQHSDTPTSQIHLARALASRHAILYVDTLGNRAPGAGGKRDIAKVVRRLAASTHGPEHLGEGLWALAPLAIPGSTGMWTGLIDRVTLVAQVKAGLRRAGALPPDVVWVASPSSVRVARQFDVPVVYYCTDDTSAFPAVNARSVLTDEAEILARAAAVVVVSDSLASVLKARGAKNVTVLENGVATALFEDPPQGAVEAARELMGPHISGRKVAVLTGTLDDRTDLGVLDEVARALPDVDFLIAGPRMPSLHGSLPQRDNIRYLGRVDHELAAGLVSQADVCIAPYADTEVVRRSSPLKVMEYLASGTPVVATDVVPLRPYVDVVQLAHSVRQFSEAVRAALAVTDAKSAQARRRRVSGMAWSAVAARFETVLESVVAESGR